ncbi:hypothetical protein LSAT2_030927 [Lamellibrachia satsuma]|nr:hypothetical protein LSAT2_030927 [Lamellibrachia satsuma]
MRSASFASSCRLHHSNATYINKITVLPERKTKRRFFTIIFTLKALLDIAPVKNPVFCVYCASTCLATAGLYSPFMYMLEKTDGLGISSQRGALLISAINVMSSISRVMTGWVSGMHCANSVVISSVAMTIGGLATISCTFCTTYYQLVLYAVVFGTCIASYISLQSVITVDLVGLDMLTNAFGLLCLFKGTASYLGPPLAGQSTFIYE